MILGGIFCFFSFFSFRCYTHSFCNCAIFWALHWHSQCSCRPAGNKLVECFFLLQTLLNHQSSGLELINQLFDKFSALKLFETLTLFSAARPHCSFSTISTIGSICRRKLDLKLHYWIFLTSRNHYSPRHTFGLHFFVRYSPWGREF